MLDLIYITLTALIFLLISLIATGVDRLGPRPPRPSGSDAREVEQP